MQKRDTDRALERYKELQQIFREDVPIYLKNRRSNLSEVASVQIREDGQSEYMADVITDEEGAIKEIRFDRVKL